MIYLGREGSWPEKLEQASIFASAAEAEAGLLAARDAAKRNLIVDPFIVDVASGTEGVTALSLRNAIRARGPTIDFTPHPATQTHRSERS